MIKRTVIGLAVTVGCLGGASWFFSVGETQSLARPYVPEQSDLATHGAAAFQGAGFGGISLTAMESHALPWRLVAAALMLDAQSSSAELPATRESLNHILAQFGFLVDAKVLNRPDGGAGQKQTMPIGVTFGDLAPIGGAKVRVSNLGCAACHAGVTYSSEGAPLPQTAWLGMPNTSLNLEAYTAAVFRAFRSGVKRPQKLLNTAQKLFPDMGFQERQTLRFLILPIVEKRMAALSGVERALPFPNGVPGSTNGVAALKFQLGIDLFDNGPGDAGIVSIPDLGDRYWRTSLLADGSYAVPGTKRQRTITVSGHTKSRLNALATITTFFTVPSMGVKTDEAIEHLDDANAIFAFLKENYRPQMFPGDVDRNLAYKGATVFAKNCSSCHGTYTTGIDQPRLTLFPNWLGDVGTDQLRADVFTKELVSAFAKTNYSSKIAVKATGQYAAPPLTGIWASAPYLHNGSVPTLHHLLSPKQRPARFQVGGHALDYERVGLRIVTDGSYPVDYQPFSEPVWFDVSQTGKDNGGHTYGANLTADEKAQLIEYLKLL